MERGKLRESKIGPFKEAVVSYGERVLEASPAMKDSHEKPYTKTRELHKARRDSCQLNQSRKKAESVRTEAESKLSSAKERVNELSRKIEESNSRIRKQILDMEKLKMADRKEGEWRTETSQYSEVMRELESIKRELSKIKLDMTSVLQEKRIAEQEIDSCSVNMKRNSRSLETLTRKNEEINGEHVLVELAKIEAIKEYGEIEAQRKESSEKYLSAKMENEKKRKKMMREIENAKELEDKLAVTLSDITMLQGGLKLMRQMQERNESKEKLRNHESNLHEGDEKTGLECLLDTITKELEAAKMELASIKDGSFQFMASMDVVRNELKHVLEETARLRKKEAKTEMIIQNLNTKLLIAKAKLEATSAAEEKARLLVSNLSLTLEQQKSTAETAKKDWSLISEETAAIKVEVEKTEIGIDLAEERMQAALQNLKAVKSSEAMALDNLKSQIEITMRNRASASKSSSTITISKFEYEYLIGHASRAKEIADKKVTAAHAWIGALKASEKEIKIQTELLQRETRNMKIEEEREVRMTEQSMNAKKVVENELENRRQKHQQKMKPKSLQPEHALHNKSMSRSFRMAPTKIPKFRRALSPVRGNSNRAPSFTVRRRTKIMPTLVKFFGRKMSSEINCQHL